MTSNTKPLAIQARISSTGIIISLLNTSYPISYPKSIWDPLPQNLKQLLLDNLTFGNTHYLPLMLNTQGTITYTTRFPLLESFLYRNVMSSILTVEETDKVPHLHYVKQFYNLEYLFHEGPSAYPDYLVPQTQSGPSALIPFTFGKESLLTFALCKEIGIEPTLVYVQEPSQPHEEVYKKKALTQLSNHYKIKSHFIKHMPGLFRYGKAFHLKRFTDLGWDSQTTLIALLVYPIAYTQGAQYIFFGSEISNNEYRIKNGWKEFLSFDQTSFWTKQQNNMIQLISRGQTGVYASLEPLEEIAIFYILHHRYPDIGKYQFSCSAEKPLYQGSQWCHTCYKCVRMYLFARACGFDPTNIGFKKDLLADMSLFDHYFGTKKASGSSTELDFTFYVLYKKGITAPAINAFKKQKLPHLKPWKWYTEKFTTLQSDSNLPPQHKSMLLRIFRQELRQFKQVLPDD